MRQDKESDRANDTRAVEIVQKMLADLPRRERDALKRFYLLRQGQEQICSDLNLSRERFLEIKREARARYEAARRGR
jgi:DNA-directed RNA polymerase specialized sigma24 family protein